MDSFIISALNGYAKPLNISPTKTDNNGAKTMVSIDTIFPLIKDMKPYIFNIKDAKQVMVTDFKIFLLFELGYPKDTLEEEQYVILANVLYKLHFFKIFEYKIDILGETKTLYYFSDQKIILNSIIAYDAYFNFNISP